MRSIDWRRLVLGAALAFCGMLAATTPAHAGDDEECLYSIVGAWKATYDSLCAKQISRFFSDDAHSVGVLFTFDSAASREVTGLFVSAVAEEFATSMELFVGGKSVGPAKIVFGGTFSPEAARAAFNALRQRQSVEMRFAYNTGSKSVTIDGTDFDAAYKRLLQ